MNQKAIDDVVENTFCRWGSDKRPDLTSEQAAKLLGISLGLGTLFNEAIEPEREWMNHPHHVFKSRPITMILAGRFNEVLEQVEIMRNVR